MSHFYNWFFEIRVGLFSFLIYHTSNELANILLIFYKSNHMSYSILSLFWLPQVTSPTFSLIISTVCWRQFILAHECWIQWHHIGTLKSALVGTLNPLKLANSTNQGLFFLESLLNISHHNAMCVCVHW